MDIWSKEFDPWSFFVILVTVIMLCILIIYVLATLFPDFEFW